MNLLLTTSCNKDCSFCFAKDVLNHSHLTMAEFKEIVDLHKAGGDIKLLGGEPTIAPIFLEAMEYLSDEKFKKNRVVIISNFLFSEKTSDAIVEFNKKKGDISFLINASESDKKQKEIITRNILNIKDKVGKINYRLGFTTNDKLEFSYYSELLDYFKDSLGEAPELRVSLPMPNPESYDGNFYLYENHKHIELIRDFVDWSIKNGSKVNLDCGLFPCMLEEDDIEYFQRWLEDFNIGCAEFQAPSDIFKNGDIYHCYPGKSIKINMSDHDNDITIARELTMRKRMALSTGELPKECTDCGHLGVNCPGPCLGFIRN